ncbi:SGNH/GDSL hydrolase family protein [Mesorhizobium sp.]|uniref:SGNH/GDSL hydrolase family protein n=2 Tax=Mesorhizobium sp. TaxID=1871066 RepID=UPI000FE50262|nr:SGNH/GDSL hydrolase family protein [Mesorhizobium sp.]RWK66996.1 MAG: SGNH/GDSL hydrolase family protein [Mesorhizobium sp.]RWK74521.1 MAG: SGNH/GDSL hydrolase family protein [Mesorhizobium sp.]RWK83823.1 MAG: SGNH/GDSL hydrolase family protein [Mesorhizobium sp.]RWK98776.1 MAG: SGNH/GDSL hydrolase family protein [Mesorhizobium sp.]RWL07903.1 MAG: SGNH/GDSL hydrolase family protein [Mesorhizobium sp.]
MARPATAAVRLLTGEREPVRLATAVNILLHGLQAIDGVPCEVGDRVLVKDQADPTQNGIYTVSEGEWFRAADARTARTLQKGTTVHAQIGSVNAGRVFEFSADAPVVGSDAITIAPFVPPDISEVAGEVESLRDATQALKDASAASAGQAAASASTSAANAGLTAADVVTTAANLAGAQAARDASLFGKGIFPTIAAAIGLGVVGHGAITAGAGGTDGTFDLAFAGGAGSGAAGRFVVAGGALTQILITAPGSYTAAPTFSFAASAGLAGAAAAAVLGRNVEVGQYFWTEVSTGVLGLYSVAAGPAATDTGVRSLPTIDAAVADRLASRLAYEDSGAAFLFAESTPAVLIKDTENAAKRFVGPVASKIAVSNAGVTYRFNALGFMEAVPANTLRFDHDPVTLSRKGLRVESARSNVVLQSRSLRITHQLTVTAGAGSFVDGETVTATGGGTGIYHAANSTSTIFALSGGAGTMTGTLTGATSGATKTISSSALVWVATNMNVAQGYVGIDGVANSASLLTATAADATVSQAITQASFPRAQDAYVKRVTGSGAVSMSMDAGATWSVITPTARWARLAIPNQTLANPTVMLKLATSGDAIAIDCVQSEPGSVTYASSPMPTTTAAFARAADVITMPTSALPGDFSTFSVYAVVSTEAPNSATRGIWCLDDGTANNRIMAMLSSITVGALQMFNANVLQMNILAGAGDPDIRHRTMASVTAGAADFGMDGTLGTTDTVFTEPAVSILRFGSMGPLGLTPLGGWIEEIIIVPRAAGDAEIRNVTAFGWPGNEPTINIAPNDSRIEDSDYYGTRSLSAAEASLVRPIVSQNYQNTTPGWCRHFNTRAKEFTLHFFNPGLSGASTNGVGAVHVDGVFYQSFTIGSPVAKTFVPITFTSVADRHIEIVMPYGMSTRFLGATIPAGATITAPATRLTLPRAAIIGDSRGHGFQASAARYHWLELLCRAKGWQHINLANGSRRLNGSTTDGTVLGQANPDVAFSIYDYNDRTDQVPLLTHKNNYKALINNFRALKPTTKLYVITSNWISAVRDELTFKIADYRQATADALTELADANNILINGLSLTTNSNASIGDGVHPNDVGSAEWAAAIAPLVSA